jgi:hypothetical protein
MPRSAARATKRIGSIIPGLPPVALDEIYEYYPTMTGLRVAAGIFAAGVLLFTLMPKVTAPISLGESRGKEDPPLEAELVAAGIGEARPGAAQAL